MRRVWVLPVSACLAAAGCSLLFDPSQADQDVAVIDAAPERDAAARIECSDPAQDCPGGGVCHCGFCARESSSCDGTRLAYVDENGEASGCVPGAVALDASFANTCALLSDGSLWCWGWNTSGQLGNPEVPAGDGEEALRPVRVARSNPAAPVDVALGINFACALLDDGTVECWGANQEGQLGAGSAQERSSTPLAVQSAASDAPLDEVEQLAAEGYHACARRADDTLWCWGHNDHAQLGLPDLESRDRAVEIYSGASRRFAIGDAFTCVVPAGTMQAQCWGRNHRGQLGNAADCPNNMLESATPHDVLKEADESLLPMVELLGVGENFGCAATSNPHQIWCWGHNRDHSLGDEADPTGDDGTIACAARENVLSVQSPVTALDGGTSFACALIAQNVYCWGSNQFKQQGVEDTNAVPYTAPGDPIFSGAPHLATGWNHACVISGEGEVFCWGANNYGQLADGTETHRAEPTKVSICP